MFDKIVVYIRKKRSRADALSHRTRAPTSVEHLPRRPQIPDGDHPEDPCHDAAAHDRDEPTHTQNAFTPPVSAGDPIMDSFTLGNTWNSFASINKLPAELLVDILLCTRLGSWFSEDRPAEPIRHMLVCRHWRDVVVDHACFWCTIDIRKSTEWFKLALSRSRQAALHLRAHNPITLASAFPDLKPHLPRILILEILCGSREEIRDLCPLLFSRLKSLTRFKIRGHSALCALVLPPERYPQLMCLEIAGLYLQWTAPLLSRLTVLSLTDCIIWPSRMDVDAFLDVLQCGQRLRKLTLTKFMGAACTDTPSRPRCPFALPSLRDLDITDSVLRVRQFAAFLQFPTYSNVRFTAELGTDDLDDGLLGPCELLLSHQLHEIPILRSAEALCLYQSVYSCGVRWIGKYLSLDFSQETIRQAPNAIMETLAETVSSSTIRILTLSIDLLHVSRAVFDSLFDALPCLTFLHLDLAKNKDGGTPLPTRALESLASIPETAGTDTAGEHVQAGDRPEQAHAIVRCRELDFIAIDGFYWHSSEILATVLRCLRVREGRGAQKVGTLEIRMKPGPRAPEDDEQDQRYATQLQEMVSRDYRFISRSG
ncbi:hypothetical protein TRAPUB_5307 [Trametes pubescens]|uniref:Uncharacterized protein n=1 Tax=Trametes pubescens TaxID=154538 RepID=A0A1M2V8N1_TRAPU|nr:hypothetical protein TRAPUB_5307 [Trametes pubescens]